jgi:tRNA pseudouridine55 synthase
MIDAVLVIDKARGMTSHDVVARVRRVLGERSIGHLGTLDPLATGVLPLLIGRYTRLAQFFGNATKRYEGVIRLGFATDTYDADGEPIGPSSSELKATLEDIQRTARRFLGDIRQTPPHFSAKKIAGVPAYKLARKKQDIELTDVQVHVESFEISKLESDRAFFSAKVSAGTYVRSLAHDLGQQLGVGAHVAELRRTASGEFALAQAVTLDRLQAMKEEAVGKGIHVEDWIGEISVHPRQILRQLPSITVNSETAGLIANGRAVNLADLSTAHQVKVFAGEKRLLAIASRIAGTLFQPKVVLGL